MLFTSRRASSHTTDGNAGQWARHATKETDRWIYSPVIATHKLSFSAPSSLVMIRLVDWKRRTLQYNDLVELPESIFEDTTSLQTL